MRKANKRRCSPALFSTLMLCSVIFILTQIPQPYYLSRSITHMDDLFRQYGYVAAARDREIESMAEKLRESVTYHPLKDLCYADKPFDGRTWFMSTLNDTHTEGEALHMRFPSDASRGRVLCIKGRDQRDGSRNYYGLAWPGFLPRNTTLKKGLTFIANNHYNYQNMWHCLSVVVPFVGWHEKNQCLRPHRWVLYHRGEIRDQVGTWVELMLAATFGEKPTIDAFDGVDNESPVCFEEAVVMRHGEKEKSLQRKTETYDLIRCKARSYCNVSMEGKPAIGMTMLMRTGARSFQNEAAVLKIFRNECAKFKGCRLTVAYAGNLSVCEQVELMSRTDILVSPHGAQLTNIFLMDKNSCVMEFFPKGWLKHAGVGQYVFQWIANWSGMRHQGAWRDPDGDPCPYPEDNSRCMRIYKDGRIGHNQTYFAEWAGRVLREAVSMNAEKTNASSSVCSCG